MKKLRSFTTILGAIIYLDLNLGHRCFLQIGGVITPLTGEGVAQFTDTPRFARKPFLFPGSEAPDGLW